MTGKDKDDDKKDEVEVEVEDSYPPFTPPPQHNYDDD